MICVGAAAMIGSEGHIGWMLVGGVLVGSGCGSLLFVVPAQELREKAIRLGDVRQRTRTEIIRRLGRPQQSTYGERDLLTWSAFTYNITLIFEGEMCLGVAQETDAVD